MEVPVLQATDRKLNWWKTRSLTKKKKKSKILSTYSAQHPQCLFKSSELHYSPKLGREPRLRGQGQPLQVEKVLTDNLYNNSALCNQDAKENWKNNQKRRNVPLTLELHSRKYSKVREKRRAAHCPSKPKQGYIKWQWDQCPDTVTNDEMVPSFVKPSRPSNSPTNRKACLLASVPSQPVSIMCWSKLSITRRWKQPMTDMIIFISLIQSK